MTATQGNSWSPRYIDAPIYRDTYVNGVVDPNARVYYLSDANYNVTGLLTWNPNTYVWSITERYTYTPYGVVTYRLGNWATTGSSANANTILYTGRTLDLAINLYYYRARYYDQLLQRFISRDPITYRGGMNLYRYCRDNPVVSVDWLGLASCPPTDAQIQSGEGPHRDAGPGSVGRTLDAIGHWPSRTLGAVKPMRLIVSQSNGGFQGCQVGPGGLSGGSRAARAVFHR